MEIELRLLAEMKMLLPEQDRAYGVSTREISDGTTLAGLMEITGIADKGCNVILVNGRHAGPERLLKQGDAISVFPPPAGG